MSLALGYEYKKTAVETSTPEKLLLMLYEGAISFLKEAISAVEEKNYPAVNEQLQRVQAIVGELMATLNPSYEVSHSLMALYDYFLRRLIEANIKKDKAIMEEVLGMLSELKEAWEEAARKARSERGKEGVAVPRPSTGLNIQW